VAANQRPVPRARARAVPIPAPAPARRSGRSLLPSARSLLVGWGIVALAVGAYAIARQTSLFAIRRIDVVGVPAPESERVLQAVGRYRGVSLVALDGAGLLDRIAAVPTVYAPAYDRAFPNTLRIVVRAERPVAVVRRGHSAWLVSARGRVLSSLPLHRRPELPRIWVPAHADIAVGGLLTDDAGGAAARSLEPLARSHFPGRVQAVALARSELVFKLASGVELRLGRPAQLRLKLAVARRILPALPDGTSYLDVSVPERPVSAANPQVSGRA
jgi:cell division protein FtsQ